MPTTLTGLVLFVALLLPGFAYLVGKERNGLERRPSAFRETVSIVAASAASESVIVAPLLLIGGDYWVDLLDDPSRHVVALTAWGIGGLSLATAACYVATWPSVREALPGDYPHKSEQSHWWRLFVDRPAELVSEAGRRDLVTSVRCQFVDGSSIEGTMADFTPLADASPDRDLLLVAPIYLIDPAGEHVRLPSHAACIAARDIRTMLVRYYFPESSAAAEPDTSGTLAG